VVEVTGTGQRDAWVAGQFPAVEPVRPGLWSIPVPIPNNPLRYVLVYLFELADGAAIVDSGWPTASAWDALVEGVAATGHEIADIRAVLVTHMHADHHGLSGRVRAASGAWVGMHALDAAIVEQRPDPQTVVEQARAWVVKRGGTVADAVAVTGTAEQLKPFLELARPDRLLDDGDRPLGNRPGVRAVWTPGHTPGHLCFYDEDANLLLSGDHLLPRISPNISLQPGQAPDPLGDFLQSLKLVGALPAIEVLPAHEYRFAGLSQRATELIAHHAERLHEVRKAVAAADSPTTWAVAQELTWSRPWGELKGFIRRSAVGETLAHLAHLERRGAVARLPGDIDRWQVID
jgi:glyoxylase-like metal-dependent hydrolase (beta-lactamase superfamily II)